MLVIDLEIDGFSATQRIIIEKFRHARSWGIRLLFDQISASLYVKKDKTDLSSQCPDSLKMASATSAPAWWWYRVDKRVMIQHKRVVRRVS